MIQIIELNLQKWFEIKPNKTWTYLFGFHYTDTLRDSLLKPYGGNASLKTNAISLELLAEGMVWCFIVKKERKKRNNSGMSVTVNKGGLDFHQT